MRQQFPRALMAPPGVPDFFSRTRVVTPGVVRVVGKAWSGGDGIARVEFSTDGGRSWSPAVLGRKNGPFGWASWYFDWHTGPPGTAHLLCARATNNHGMTQDEASDEQFNAHSMGGTQPALVYVKAGPKRYQPRSWSTAC